MLSKLEDTTSPIEAIFWKYSCHLNRDVCINKFEGLPKGLDLEHHSIVDWEFRLEDQTKWRGQVIVDKENRMTLHKLYPVN